MLQCLFPNFCDAHQPPQHLQIDVTSLPRSIESSVDKLRHCVCMSKDACTAYTLCEKGRGWANVLVCVSNTSNSSSMGGNMYGCCENLHYSAICWRHIDRNTSSRWYNIALEQTHPSKSNTEMYKAQIQNIEP